VHPYFTFATVAFAILLLFFVSTDAALISALGPRHALPYTHVTVDADGVGVDVGSVGTSSRAANNVVIDIADLTCNDGAGNATTRRNAARAAVKKGSDVEKKYDSIAKERTTVSVFLSEVEALIRTREGGRVKLVELKNQVKNVDWPVHIHGYGNGKLKDVAEAIAKKSYLAPEKLDAFFRRLPRFVLTRPFPYPATLSLSADAAATAVIVSPGDSFVAPNSWMP
jgi:hypothetical protein